MSEYNENHEFEIDKEFGPTFFDVPRALSILQSPTPQELIKIKEQKKGPDLEYVTAATVIRTLNKAFGLRWNFRVHETRVVESSDYYDNAQGKVIQTLGELTVPGLGTRMQWGSQSVVGGQQTQEHAFKGSTSDALKKCAMMFLVHLDLSDKGPLPDQALGPQDLPSFDMDKYNAPQQQQQQQESPVTSQAPNPVDVAVPDAVEESIDTIPESNNDLSEPQPQQQQQVQSQPQQTQEKSTTWSPDDIHELKGHKERLSLDTNEALNPYIQTFFGNQDMTFRQLTHTTIKDFNHYLSSQ